jgi:hypothetical protein
VRTSLLLCVEGPDPVQRKEIYLRIYSSNLGSNDDGTVSRKKSLMPERHALESASYSYIWKRWAQPQLPFSCMPALSRINSMQTIQIFRSQKTTHLGSPPYILHVIGASILPSIPSALSIDTSSHTKMRLASYSVSCTKRPDRLKRCFDLDNPDDRLESLETSLSPEARSVAWRPWFRTGCIPKAMTAL